MRVTAITVQQKDPNRVNVLLDGRFRFSMDISQVSDLKIKIGNEYNERELSDLEAESQFGKLYARTLEYCLMRPHSSREVRDYLYRKTLSKKYKSRRTGEIKERQGISEHVTERVFNKLVERGYIDDDAFARYWVENRNQRKGSSRRKLEAELMAKGVDRAIIEQSLALSGRNDSDELQKIIIKKRGRYVDNQKFMQYLARQGFSYEDIKASLFSADEE